MDQEIDTSEDDLLQMEKIVETKQLYTEEITAKIAKKLKEMQYEVEKTKDSAMLKKVKSSPSLIQKLFGW